MKNRVKWSAALTALILFSGILGYSMLTDGQDWGGDFAAYIMQAKSIVEGNIQGEIENSRYTATKSSRNWRGPYPWGTAVLLAPLYKLFGMDIFVFKNLNIVFYILFLISIAIFLRERHGNLYHFLLVSMFALNPTMLSYLNNVLSDIPFLFFSTTSVFLIGRAVMERRPLISKWVDHFLLGVMLAVSFFIRVNGVLLVLTLVGVHFIILLKTVIIDDTAGRCASAPFRRFISVIKQADFKTTLIHFLPYITFIGITLILRSIFAYEGTFANDVPSYLSRTIAKISFELVKYNAHEYMLDPVKFFMGVPRPLVLYIATLPFLLIGIINSAGRDYHMILYSFLTIVLYLVFSGNQGLRYFFPVLPFYVYFVFAGLQWCFKALGGSWAKSLRVLTSCLLILIAFYFARFSTLNAYSNMLNHRKFIGGTYAETSQEMFSFIRENLPEDAVIVFWKPRVMRMSTDRKSIMVDKSSDLSRGSHICISLISNYCQIPPRDVEKLERKGMLKLIFANSDFRLYQIMNTDNKSIHTDREIPPLRSSVPE